MNTITHCVGEMMATDPFSVVEDVGLMAELEPRYVLPSRRYFSEVLIPEIYAKVKQRVTESTNHVSLNTDIWTSTNCQHSFLSLTAHFIVTSSVEKKDVMLCLWQFDESKYFSCNFNIRSCVLRDNASNMIAGMNIANVKTLSCLAHSLQLIIKDRVLMQPAVQQLLNTARSLVGHYHSNVAFQTFRQIQSQLKLPEHVPIQHVPIQDVSTRWNSSYYMLQRLAEQKKAITAANTECHPPVELQTQQWTLAEKVVKLLKVFEEATREVSGDYSSASVIIPIINTLKKNITQEEDRGIMAMKRGMLRSLADRYGNIEQEPLCILTTVLDPRFKLKGFSSASMLECC